MEDDGIQFDDDRDDDDAEDRVYEEDTISGVFRPISVLSILT